MTIAKQIKDNLIYLKLESTWNRKKYVATDKGASPLCINFESSKPRLLMYEGIFDSDGEIDFCVGINSVPSSRKYEFYIDDFSNATYSKIFDSFEVALIYFKNMTGIIDPVSYIVSDNVATVYKKRSRRYSVVYS
jgi:hypothetical protein